MKLRYLSVIALLCVSAFGQMQHDRITVNGIAYNTYTIAAGARQIPLASANNGLIIAVSDGASSSDCTAGGGSSVVVCRSNGSSWSAFGAAFAPATVTDPWTDARSAGLVCASAQTTAATDNSAAWNALFGTVDSSTGKTIKLPPCALRVDEATIFGQDSLTIAGWNEGVTTTGNLGKTVIFSCSSNTGGVITINRSSRLYIKGIEFEIKGSGCTSNKTKNIVGQNSGGTGYTSTQWIFDQVSSLSGATNYVGVDLSFTPNGEQMTFISPYFNCQYGTNSTAILFGGGNEDLAKISGEPRLSQCYRTVRSSAPNLEISGGFVTGGDFSHFGAGGAGIYIDSCQRVHVHDMEESDSGQFLRMGFEDGGSANNCNIEVNSNTISPSDIGAGVNLITLAGLSLARYSVHDNTINIGDVAYNKPIIGSQTFSANGPQGSLTEYNNSITGTSQPITAAANNSGPAYQSGEFHPEVSRTADFSYKSPTPISGGGLPVRSASVGLYAGHASGATYLFDGVKFSAVPVGAGNTTVPYILGQLDTPNGLSGSPVFTFDGTYSGVHTTQIAQPTLLWATHGTGGGTSYTYAIVAYDATGHSLASATVTHAASNAVLNSTNYNYQTWNPVAGATKYCIWRTASGGTPSSTGSIGCVSVLAALVTPLDSTMSFNDTGLAGDSAPLPSGNTSGQVQADGGAIVGASGSLINTILNGSATLTYTAISAQTSQEQTVTISGASTTNFGVFCSPRATLSNANISWSAWVSSSNTVSVRVTNPTAGSVTPTAVVWGCTVNQ